MKHILIATILLYCPLVAADAPKPPLVVPEHQAQRVKAEAEGDKLVDMMDGEIARLRAQVQSLTAERDALKAQLAAEQLRAEAEKAKAVQDERDRIFAEIAKLRLP